MGDNGEGSRVIISKAVQELDKLTVESLAAQMLLGQTTPDRILEYLTSYAERHPVPKAAVSR